MRKHLALAAVVCLFSAPALAQTAVGVGTGISKSSSQSAAGAVAIGGGNAQAQGGRGGSSSSSLTVNGTPATTTSNVNQTLSGTTTSNVNQNLSGTTTSNQNVNTTGMQTLKTVPNAYSPGLSAAGLETCLGSISGGGSAVGWGASFGTTIPDPGCNARLDARTLWSMGLKAAAIARLCQSVDIYHSMPDICTRYSPQPGQPTAYGAYASVNPGAIELTDGKTGQVRMCDNYDAARFRCLAWQGEAPRGPTRRARMAAVHRKPLAAAPTAVKPSAVVGAGADTQTEPTKEN